MAMRYRIHRASTSKHVPVPHNSHLSPRTPSSRGEKSVPLEDATTIIIPTERVHGVQGAATTTLMIDTGSYASTTILSQPTVAPESGHGKAEASHDGSSSRSSPKVTAVTVGGFVGAFVVVLALAAGLFVWYRRRAKRRRQSYSKIPSMPWDRSPIFMTTPHQSQSYKAMSYSFSDSGIEARYSTPKLEPPPRPPPPVSKDMAQIRRKSSGLILPPKPELEYRNSVGRGRELDIQLKGRTTTTTDSNHLFMSMSEKQTIDSRQLQTAELSLAQPIKLKNVQRSMVELYPDSPTLAQTPIRPRYSYRPDQQHPDSPTSVYSQATESTGVREEVEKDVARRGIAARHSPYQEEKQVYINSPTSAHMPAPPREFHKSTRYLYPDIPSTPRTPPAPKQAHVSTAYLYTTSLSPTPSYTTPGPEEKRRKLQKPNPGHLSSSSFVPAVTPAARLSRTSSRISRSLRRISNIGSPPPPLKDSRKTIHISSVAVRHQEGRNTIQDLRPRTGTFEQSIIAPLNILPRAPPIVTPPPRLDLPGPRPKTVTFESTIKSYDSYQSRIVAHPRTTLPRSRSLGPGTSFLISDSDPVSIGPRIETDVVNKTPTKYQYPASPRLARRSTSNSTADTQTPRARTFPHRSSSLNPNSHTSNNNLTNNPNPCNTINEVPTSPPTDSALLQDMRSTKYLSSEFAGRHSIRREVLLRAVAENIASGGPTDIWPPSSQDTNSTTSNMAAPSRHTANPTTSYRNSTMTLPVQNPIRTTSSLENLNPRPQPPWQVPRPSSTPLPPPPPPPTSDKATDIGTGTKWLLNARPSPAPIPTKTIPPTTAPVELPGDRPGTVAETATPKSKPSPAGPDNHDGPKHSTIHTSTPTPTVNPTPTPTPTPRPRATTNPSPNTAEKPPNPPRSNSSSASPPSARRGHYSIQPQHRLMTPLSRGINPTGLKPGLGMGMGIGMGMGMSVGIGSGGGWI